MTEVACPICDYVTDLADAPDAGLIPGLAESLGLTGLSTAAVDYIEKDLGEHLLGHSVSDWVTAMRMADAYIETLEAKLVSERELAKTMATRFQAQLEAAVRPSAGFSPSAGLPVPQDGYGALPPPILPPEWGGAGIASPRERQEQRAALRKAGLLPPPPKDTLVPIVNSGSRPEGYVGRRA